MDAATYGRQSPIANELHYGVVERCPASTLPQLELYSVDLATWDDGYWAHQIFVDRHPDGLDEPWPYRFTNGERVWICARGVGWRPGKIVSQPKGGKTRLTQGLYWCAEFYMGSCRVRRWFAPLNGDIKPNIKHTHRLLSEAGWL